MLEFQVSIIYYQKNKKSLRIKCIKYNLKKLFRYAYEHIYFFDEMELKVRIEKKLDLNLHYFFNNQQLVTCI